MTGASEAKFPREGARSEKLHGRTAGRGWAGSSRAGSGMWRLRRGYVGHPSTTRSSSTRRWLLGWIHAGRKSQALEAAAANPAVDDEQSRGPSCYLAHDGVRFDGVRGHNEKEISSSRMAVRIRQVSGLMDPSRLRRRRERAQRINGNTPGDSDTKRRTTEGGR